MDTGFLDLNIGCVVYKKDFKTGKLDSNWHFAFNDKFVTGTGKAIGSPGEKFSGKYSITYYNSKGIDVGSYDLIITESNNSYRLQWYQNGTLKCTGIGMLSENLLIAGWMKV